MTDGRTSDFKQLNVWQASMGLVKDIYSVARDLPVNERYGLIYQIKRSAVSIPSNIAEGQARGSAAELETQLILTKELELLDCKRIDDLLYKLRGINLMLSSLNKYLSSKSPET